jgi:hypothetical protein
VPRANSGMAGKKALVWDGWDWEQWLDTRQLQEEGLRPEAWGAGTRTDTFSFPGTCSSGGS